MSVEGSVDLEMSGEDGRLAGRLALPLRVRVGGVEAVLVSAEAYDALFRAAGKSVGQRSRVERDPDVQRFIDDRLTTHDLPTIRTAVAQQFGEARAPSLSGLHRYAMARRQAAGAVTSRARSRSDSRGPR